MSELRIELENAIKNLGIHDYRVDKPEQIVSEIKRYMLMVILEPGGYH